jgi:hypothetical protein
METRIQNPEITALTDKLGEELYNINPSVAKAEGICIDCRQPAIPNCHSSEGVKEYYISGLCEKCFDAMFEE